MSRQTLRAVEPTLEARRLRLAGHVQGVGFRPFVYRLAHALGITGTVRNLQGEVDILAQGTPSALERFARELIDDAPPLAQPRVLFSRAVEPVERTGFQILESAAGEHAHVFVPPDYLTCEQCLEELGRTGDRRYRYPFINCTQCGPRYTLIEALPYDRVNTSMSGFALCADCRREYEDPLDRRFHAEPIACPACGPRLWLESFADVAREPQKIPVAAAGEAALVEAVQRLRSGAILAVKGIGGYHLMCDASSTAAVARLRLRKLRPHKPFAVMFPVEGVEGLAALRRAVRLSGEEARLVRSPARPIVLAARRPGAALTCAIAPGLDELGVFLPYSPLHHLLLKDFGGPLVATSANVSGEPVLTDPQAVRSALAAVADAGLHHDRPIVRPADDTVVRVLQGRTRTLRLGRGLAPRELSLPRRLARPVLAVGGHLKTTVALAWEDRVVLSPHIGDMGSVRSEAVLVQVIRDLQRLYGVEAAEVVCDAHPAYATSRWAESSGLPLARVLHHHAHASALAGEHAIAAPMLVFTWDGIGYGGDGTLWGGEALVGRPGAWRRVASLRPFSLPGGERAARAPWRSAAALCWEIGQQAPGAPPDPLVRLAWERQINCPRTSSVGRLFDAAAALLLGVRETSFEGQAPMLLEAAARAAPRSDCVAQAALPVSYDESGLARLDWEPLMELLIDEAASVESRAAAFHGRLAASLLAVAQEQRAASGVDCVGLTGGVFQNALLSELASEALTGAGFTVHLAERVPCNDGGLAYGQIIEHVGRSTA